MSGFSTGKLSSRFRVTLIHPCVGRRRADKRYVRTWLMQPLQPAMLASLVPDDTDIRFHDDRLEAIPFDERTDLVAISVETYTARRAYQIASEYRRRGVPVVMGGFHATLCPEEVSRHCESVVVGEAEKVFATLISDYQRGRFQRVYSAATRPSVLGTSPNRSLFDGKRYLPVTLIEFSRGCKFVCDFCAVQSAYQATHLCRPIDAVLEEVDRTRKAGRMVFFVDDNLTSSLDDAKSLMHALIPRKIRWVSQCDISVAYDTEALDLMKRSGCQGVLVGFESLDRNNLKTMNKGFNLMRGGPADAIQRFQRHGLRLYGTFVFGYDSDTASTFEETLRFATAQGLFIGAFNHITPFPGTPLYQRLADENRLLYDSWWLDERYRYGEVPFAPRGMSAATLAEACIAARTRFYSWRNIAARATNRANRRDPWMFLNYLFINAMHHNDISQRNGLPLGDETWQGEILRLPPATIRSGEPVPIPVTVSPA